MAASCRLAAGDVKPRSLSQFKGGQVSCVFDCRPFVRAFSLNHPYFFLPKWVHTLHSRAAFFFTEQRGGAPSPSGERDLSVLTWCRASRWLNPSPECGPACPCISVSYIMLTPLCFLQTFPPAPSPVTHAGQTPAPQTQGRLSVRLHPLLSLLSPTHLPSPCFLPQAFPQKLLEPVWSTLSGTSAPGDNSIVKFFN